jgi:alpha-tubulin suppressor-like RCC1 family protein
VTALAAGGTSVCALAADGAVYCAGESGVGDGVRRPGGVIVRVPGIDDAKTIVAGNPLLGSHACALRATGGVVCWGSDEYGQLGDGFPPGTGQYDWDGEHRKDSAARAVQGIDRATSIAAGGDHTCAVIASGAVLCWGDDDWGETGQKPGGFDADAKAVAGIEDAVAVSAGPTATCALRAGGSVSCWGFIGHLVLGEGASHVIVNGFAPVDVPELRGALAVSVASDHLCGLFNGGEMRCVGGNKFGQLGVTGPGWLDTVTPAQGLGLVASFADGAEYMCAVRSAGGVLCWGSNVYGELGVPFEKLEWSAAPVSIGEQSP